MSDIDKFAKEGVLRFLVGNKCDLESKREVSFQEGKDLAKLYGIPFFETSAKDTVNVEEVFISMVKTHLEKMRLSNEPLVRRNRSSLTASVISFDRLNIKGKQKNKEKSGCC